MSPGLTAPHVPDSIAEWLGHFEKLSLDKQEEHVFALGPQDAAQLLAIAEHATDDVSGAYAIERLTDLEVSAAIEPLCALLGKVDYDSDRREALLMNLSCFGPALLEPLLRVRDGLTEPWRRDDAVLALCENEDELPKDERVFVALCELLTRNRDLGADLLEQYGDARAIPLLEQAIDGFVPDFNSVASEREFKSLVGAHYRMGGELPDALHERIHDWLDTWQARFAPPASVRRATLKLGRNDPCRCGSGKKYKKCCLGKEATST